MFVSFTMSIISCSYDFILDELSKRIQVFHVDLTMIQIDVVHFFLCGTFFRIYKIKNLKSISPLFTIKCVYNFVIDYRISFCFLFQGGLIEIQQNWHCNFDIAKEEKECFPTFVFNLLQSGSDKLSPGINYRLARMCIHFIFDLFLLICRFAEKFHVNGITYRTLTKIYGFRFILSIKGGGRRFDAVNLFVAIGT